VNEAKRQLRGRVEIDHEAGPSEVVILADDSADARFLAADLLAQAEHGSGDETVMLVTTSAERGAQAARLVAQGLPGVANVAAARRALARNGAVVQVADLDEGLAFVNALAPEHAQVLTRRAAAVARRVLAGAVFVGAWAPAALGDYGIGPNHVLPTGGAARHASPLSVRISSAAAAVCMRPRRPAPRGRRRRARGHGRGLPRSRAKRAGAAAPGGGA